MSTVGSARDSLDLLSEPASDPVLRRVLAAAQICWSAAVDGLAAARTYQELTRRGAPHEQAVEQVFDRHLGAR